MKTQLRGVIVLALVLLNVVIVENGFVHDERWYYLLLVAVPGLIVTAARPRGPRVRGK
ncbi:hypothetical protein ACQ86N_03475 [Puia sp. P3]|uniref:hypothetical protein n=1 Tax=Puia sp. P3 TaxID=3423952 RepID=UPI003D66B2AC